MALVEAVSSSSLWGSEVFWALPTDPSLLWGTLHLKFHTCHFLFVTLSLMVSFLFIPWQEVRRVSFGRCFSCWLPAEQWYFSASVHSSSPIAQVLSVLLEVGLLCTHNTSCALGYMSSQLLKSVLFTLDQGLQSQGVTSYWRTLCWTERERYLYSWSKEVLLLDTGKPSKDISWDITRKTEQHKQIHHGSTSQVFLESGLVNHYESTIFLGISHCFSAFRAWCMWARELCQSHGNACPFQKISPVSY